MRPAVAKLNKIFYPRNTSFKIGTLKIHPNKKYVRRYSAIDAGGGLLRNHAGRSGKISLTLRARWIAGNFSENFIDFEVRFFAGDVSCRCMTPKDDIELLFRTHYAAMHRTAMLMLRDEDVARDIVHDLSLIHI